MEDRNGKLPIRLLLYKAGKDGKWMDNAISLWTKLWNSGTGPYSHAEIWIPERVTHRNGNAPSHFNPRYVFEKSDLPERYKDKPWKIHSNHDVVGHCYTSTMGALRNNPIGKREDSNVDGVVIRPTYQVLKHPERWDYIEIWLDPQHWSLAVTWARQRAQMVIKYDRWAILSFFLPWRLHSDRADICSECCYDFLLMAGFFKDADKVPSPRRLSQWVLDRDKSLQIQSLA
jgi:hypothetical protein